MAYYLVAGRAASGKSTLAVSLAARLSDTDYKVFDTDQIRGLAHWEDAETGKWTRINDYTQVDRDRYKWIWNMQRLLQICVRFPDVIFCGSADNDLEVANRLQGVFALDVSPEVQRERLLTRTNSNYGQSEAMAERIVEEQRRFMERARTIGAVIVNADLPVEVVATEIIRHIDEH